MDIVYLAIFVPAVTLISSAVWIRVIKLFDSNAKIKGSIKEVSNFFFYGFLSIPLTILINYTVHPLYDIFYGNSWLVYFIFYNFLIVGMIEESAKFLVFFLFAFKTGAVREPKDGLVYGAAVGLAFAVAENLVYSRYGADLLIYRAITAAPGHMCLSAIWGYAAGAIIYKWRQNNKTSFAREDLKILFSSIVFAAFVHGLHNILVTFGLGYGLMVNIFTLLFALKAHSHLKNRSPYKVIPYTSYREAIPLFKEGLNANPENFMLNRQIALHYLRSGNFGKAVFHIKKALDAKPGDLSAQLYYSLINIITGEAGPAYLRAEHAAKKMKLFELLKIRNEAVTLFRDKYQQILIADVFEMLIKEKKSTQKSSRISLNKTYNKMPEKGYVRYARPVPVRTAGKASGIDKTLAGYKTALERHRTVA